MALDIDLPVWTIKPNWSGGILERLEWLTLVLGGTYGPEQRIATRLSPRRSFEMTFNPVDETRSYFDLWLHRLGSQEFMVPLWHDKGRLSAPIAFHATVIPMDTTNREFKVGDLAILVSDTFVSNKVQVTAVAADSLTVAALGVTQAWKKGSAIYPLRRSRISQESLFSALVNRVGQATLQFELNQANDLTDEGEWDALYSGYPILTTEPNRVDPIDLTFIRNTILIDGMTGLTGMTDDAGRAFTMQSHSFLTKGRANQMAFRQMLYRLAGRQGTIWVPTFNRDVKVSRDAVAADSSLAISKIGYSYTGGSVSGRQHLLLDGNTPARITGLGTAPSAVEERLSLSAPIGADYAAGRYGSFMEPCRLDNDSVEIMHHTDTDGAAECKVNFRSFRDERTTPDPIHYPIPAAAESSERCGEPAEGDDTCVPEDSTSWLKLWIDFWSLGGPGSGPSGSEYGPPSFPYYGLAVDEDGNGSYERSIGNSSDAIATLITAPHAVQGIIINGPKTGADYTRTVKTYKLDLQFNFSAFPTGDHGWATVRYKKWDETDWTFVPYDPGPGADGASIQIFRLSPANYFLTF